MDSGLLNPEILKVLGVPTGGALVLAALLLWRFERIVHEFLKAMKTESDNNRSFLTNHMRPMTEAFSDMCGEMKGLCAIISDCAARKREQ